MKIDDIEKIEFLNYITYQIKYNRTNFSEIGFRYIESLGGFFERVKDNLKCILNPQERFNSMEKLFSIYQVIEGGKKPTRRNIQSAITKIQKARILLENLVQNPKEFYQRKESEELLRLCEKIGHVYEEKTLVFI